MEENQFWQNVFRSFTTVVNLNGKEDYKLLAWAALFSTLLSDPYKSNRNIEYLSELMMSFDLKLPVLKALF